MVLYYHKPLTTIYGDNYRYGTSLYIPGMDDVEKTYRNTLSKTHVRSDRGDLGLYSFAGSHIHGGTPAAEKLYGVTPYGSKSYDLYAPVDTSYRPGYYDHLRAQSPEPRKRPTKTTPSSYTTLPEDYHIPADIEYKTLPSRITTNFDDDLKKTTTKTTTRTETWVPLTTYIYNTPYHTYYYKSTPYSSYTYRSGDDLYSYNYVDDYKRYATTTTTTKTKNIDSSDIKTSSSYEKFNYDHYMGKCHEIQSQLDQVNKWVSEAESKIKSEVITSRNKIQTELAEVSMVVEDTARYNDELHRAIRKQSKQISELSSQYDNINRNIGDVLDALDKSRQRCTTLQSEISSVQTGLQMAAKWRA